DSRGVINTILDLEKRGYQVQYITGNHEVYMLNALRKDDDEYLQHWLRSGGDATLDSYRNAQGEPDSSLEQHLEWMASLPFYLELEDYLLVHAGLNFSVPNPFEDLESIIMIRRWYANINHQWLGDKKIVHGHTPIDEETMLNQTYPTRHPYPVYNIDGGCFMSRRGFGHLAVFDLDLRSFKRFANIDQVIA
ncbi:MAG: hypothetical protein AAFU03_17300, partial [Bacteroidota bacterium]